MKGEYKGTKYHVDWLGNIKSTKNDDFARSIIEDTIDKLQPILPAVLNVTIGRQPTAKKPAQKVERKPKK